MLAHLLIDLLELCDLAGFGGRRLGPGHLFVAGTYGLKRGALCRGFRVALHRGGVDPDFPTHGIAPPIGTDYILKRGGADHQVSSSR